MVRNAMPRGIPFTKIIMSHISVGDPGHILSFRTINVNRMAAIVRISFINNMHISDYFAVPFSWQIIASDISSTHITFLYKAPAPVMWMPFTSQGKINADTISQGCPSIITWPIGPFYPCRTPGIVRYPEPADIMFMLPAAVVKGRPSPVEI